jgi:hypothetical protein
MTDLPTNEPSTDDNPLSDGQAPAPQDNAPADQTPAAPEEGQGDAAGAPEAGAEGEENTPPADQPQP